MPGGGAQVLPARDPASTFLLIASFLGRTGQDRVDFGLAEPHTVLFHEPGSSSVWVGGRGRVYLFDFPEGKNASMRTVSLEPSASPRDTVSPSLPLTHLFISSLALVRGLRESGELASLPKLVYPHYIPEVVPGGGSPKVAHFGKGVRVV